MGMDRDHVILAQQALTRGDPEGRWLRLLEVFLPVGVADMNQLQAATGFSRDQVKRLLDKFRQATGGGQPMLTRVEVKVARPWLGARGAVIYQLAETGAALLRAAGHEDARACGLKEAVAIAHAAAMLDVRLVALAAGLTVATETELCNDAERDVAARQSDRAAGWPPGDVRAGADRPAGAAAAHRRGRAPAAEFFSGQTARPVSPIIRVLFALPRNATWERTLRIWERAVAAVADECGGTLPFSLLAMPLGEFLAQPDWSEPPDSGRWRDLLNPGLLAGFAPSAAAERRSHRRSRSGPATKSLVKQARLSWRATRRTSRAWSCRRCGTSSPRAPSACR